MNTPPTPGTFAKVAIQCKYPGTTKEGSFLFTGDSHRNPNNIRSPRFNDCAELHRYAVENGWKSEGSGYVKL